MIAPGRGRSTPEYARKGREALRAQWYLRSATRVARTARVDGRLAVSNAGTLIVGDRVRFVGTIVPTELAVGPGGTLDIGARTFINYGTSIAATLDVRIGRGCNLGTYCMLMDNDFHCLEPERRHERPASSPIVLGENVWLGGRVVVMGGVTIGDHSAVGAGSVVTRDIPPNTVAAGVPAKVIRGL